MEIRFSDRVKERFPTMARLATITLKDTDNTGSKALDKIRDDIRHEIKTNPAAFRKLPALESYSKYYDRYQESFVLKKQIMSVGKGKDIPTLSPLVDSMLLAELKNGILMGIMDWDRIERPITFDEAKEGEKFFKRGNKEVVLRQGDLVLRDMNDIIASFFEGQSEKTKVHRKTKRAILLGFYAPGIKDSWVRKAMGDAANFAKVACKADLEPIRFHGKKIKIKPKVKPKKPKKVKGIEEPEKLDPWASQSVKDYGKIMKKFGIKSFRSMAKKIPNPHLYMKRGVIFGHRDFGKIVKCMKKKKPFVMLTGLMPSGKFHIGHKMVADEFIYLQSKGAKTYICVADIEAYNMRGKSLEELRKTAIEEYLLNYIALGLKPKNCEFYFQSSRSKDPEKANAFYRLIGIASRRVTMNEMKAIYGDLSPGKIMSVLTQVADILHPQLPEFEGEKTPTVVPVGIDQDPHIKLTRDIAARLNKTKHFHFTPPSSTYHRFMRGLKGGKMSSSDPNSYIALTDKPGTVKKKIMKYAFSGGASSVEEHRKKGGNPDVDVSFNMLRFMFEPDDKKLKKIEEDYRSGALLTGELKQIAAEKVITFLKKHQKKREKARKKVDKFLKTSSGF